MCLKVRSAYLEEMIRVSIRDAQLARAEIEVKGRVARLMEVYVPLYRRNIILYCGD